MLKQNLNLIDLNKVIDTRHQYLMDQAEKFVSSIKPILD